MSFYRFILQSLIHFRRQHLALFAGTLIATAVLTGAFIIGDSVHYSLLKLTETRLGNIRYIVNTGGRFVRSELASEFSAALDVPASPVLLLQGIAVNPENREKINRVQVAGIDSSFWDFAKARPHSPTSEEAVLSENTALKLGLKVGDVLLLRVEKAGLIPINAPFSPEGQPSTAFRLKIVGIADDDNLGRFSLKSNQVAQYTVFLNRDILAEKMELAELANIILLGENNNNDLLSDKITRVFAQIWKPKDAGLKARELPGSGKYEVISNRVFIDKPICDAIEKLNIPHQNILTYLVNAIRTRTSSTPYSFAVATSSDLLPGKLNPDDIVINEWLAGDLSVKTGDTLNLDYFVIGPLRKLNKKSRVFRVSAIIPTKGSFTDSTLMPDFPGLSNAGNCRDWNTGVPVDLKLIRDKDEQYWDTYRGTPKAMIALSTGMEMWANPFGEYTSVRFSKTVITPDSLLNLLMDKIEPQQLGMNVIPVYSEGLSSAGNEVDFGQLFLGLSFFIIAASLLLIVLIFSLTSASRSVEIALLSGLGLSSKLIMRIRLTESFIVVLFGSIFGALAGILYNVLLVKALNTVWQGAIQTGMLEIHIRGVSLITGAGIGFLLGFLTIIFVSRRKLKDPVAGLLRGNHQGSPGWGKNFMPGNGYFSMAGLLSSVLLTSFSLFSGAYEDPGLFLSAGALFLFGSISGIAWLLKRMQHSRNYLKLDIFQLAIKNAGRNKGRSLAVVFVLAIGVFSIILTGSYHKTFSGSENIKSSGTGGYLFWAETSIPIPADLNESGVQKKYLLTNSLMSSRVNFEQFHSLEGDDASCLNLNQVLRPRILGVNPRTFNERQAFSFISLLDGDARVEPWLQLEKNMGDDVIPAFADQSVIQYGLKKSLGDTLFYLNEKGEKIKIVLVGGLDNSVFQGNILIDDTRLLKEFPSAGGTRVMLIDAPLTEESNIEEIMKLSFADYGIEISKASFRLAAFNSVENTYLSVFMILGGLGFIIGTIGLAIVLFRNILERKHEFAILSALGLKEKQVIRMIMTENIFLFFSGLGCGILAAVISILPSLLAPGFHTSVIPILIILLVVILNGIFWIWIPARSALKGNNMEALRNE